MTESRTKRSDLSIVLCGQAGQGIQTVEKILVQCLKSSGFHVFATKEYMSRVRGGMNSTEIRVSSERVSAYVDRMDILMPFHQGALFHLEKRFSAESVVIGDRERICTDCPDFVHEFLDVPLAKIAEDVGGRIFVNVIAAGVVLGLFAANTEEAAGFLRRFFAGKSEEVIQKNITAFERGYSHGKRLMESNTLAFNLSPDPLVGKEILVNGAEAVGMGALAGGCNFLASYPMSPSTGVMVFLAHQTGEYDLIVEQAEDEISAINMALGASYAGARSMVTTSGGGFALMTEGVSLAGMIETPVVIHVAQRPGPATGLPTRTEQGDLELVLYAGHGEFPRAIFAPGTLQEAFDLTHRAFNLADKYQIPVFLLTDQYFIDSYYNTSPFNPALAKNKVHIVKTKKDYMRFALTRSGVSPRGIPGYGEGLVGVDSDEHGEDAHITEDLDLRTRMVDKRLKKLEGVRAEALPPNLIGADEYKTLIIGWGSTLLAIREALQRLQRNDIALLHFKQVYPLPSGTREILAKAQRRIMVENSATSQFSRLIARETGIEVERNILKYSGLAFSAEELAAGIKKILAEEKRDG